MASSKFPSRKGVDEEYHMRVPHFIKSIQPAQLESLAYVSVTTSNRLRLEVPATGDEGEMTSVHADKSGFRAVHSKTLQYMVEDHVTLNFTNSMLTGISKKAMTKRTHWANCFFVIDIKLKSS
jgi:hypothetical protein